MTNALKTVYFGGQTKDTVSLNGTVLHWNGTVFTTETTDAANATLNDVLVTSAVGHILYFGHDNPFDALRIIIGSTATTGMVGVWEYQDLGGTWVTLSVTASAGTVNLAGAAASIQQIIWDFTQPDGQPGYSGIAWQPGTVNSITKYWVRFRCTTAPTAGSGTLSYVGFAPAIKHEFSFRLPESGAQIMDAGLTFNAHLNTAPTSIIRRCVYARLVADAGIYSERRVINNASTISGTGENIAWQLDYSMLSLFEDGVSGVGITTDPSNGHSYWSGGGGPPVPGTGVMTWTFWASMFTAATAANVMDAPTFRLWVTYKYDDSVTTQLKTVMIPMQSSTGALTTTLAQVGTDQVPALNTFLPEATKVYKDIHFVVSGNTAATSTASYNLEMDLGAGTGTNRVFGVSAQNNAGQTGTFEQYVASYTDVEVDTDSDMALRLRTTSTSGAPWRLVSVLMVVTYEFDASTTTRVINSLQMPLVEEPGYLPNSSTETALATKDFYIEEPGTITLARAGVIFALSDPGNLGTLSVYCARSAGDVAGTGSSSTGFIVSPGSVTAGQFTMGYRIDDKTDGVDPIFVPQRGKNSVIVGWYTNVGGVGGGTSGLLYLNYTSDKASRIGKHARTVRSNLTSGADASQDAVLQQTTQVADLPSTLDLPRFNLGYGFEIHTMASGAARALVLRTLTNVYDWDDVLTAGWRDLFSQFVRSDAELGFFCSYVRARDEFERWRVSNGVRSDPEQVPGKRLVTTITNLDPSYERWFSLDCTEAVVMNVQRLHTYHQHTFTVSGTVSGYTGDGSGIAVDIFRANTDEKVLTLTTTTGGAYTGTWFDSAEKVYAVARQDDTHLGRSADFYAA